MSGTDILDTETPAPPSGQHREGWFSPLRRLSERTSLRTKLITAVLALVIIALALISIASVYMLRSYVETRQDTTLRQNFARYYNTPVSPQTGDANLPQIVTRNGIQLLQPGNAVAANSELVYALQVPGSQVNWYATFMPPGSSSDSSQGPLPELPTSTTWASSADGALLSVPSTSGPDTWRVIAQTQTYPVEDSAGNIEQEKLTLVIAVDLGDISAMTTRLVLFDIIVGGAIVIVLATVAIGVVRANLRPLDDIELTAQQIAAGHLNHRVPEGDPRTEIGSLGRSLNAMLAQIERAFHAQGQAEQAAHQSEERMRRFIADAAHELRTPLTTIRGFAAHYRQRGGTGSGSSRMAVDGFAQSSGTGAADSPGSGLAPAGITADSGAMSPEELDRLMGRVESEATRMGLLVEDLLTLARLDQQRPLSKGPVDLLSLAADAVQDARIVSPGRPISLSVAPGTAFIVDGDEPRLRQVLANLVNNAITHTPAGTPVRVKIARDVLDASPAAGRYEPAPAVLLDVEDDGPGMAPEQAQRVFERFYRADAARNRASGGTGLGLAIVAGLISAHGGTVGVRTAPGQGADFQVKLPLSPDVLGVDGDDD